MNRKTVILLSVVLTTSLAGCAGRISHEDTGAITGAIAGGIIGNQVGGGMGKSLATGAGFLIGAVIGANIGRHLDESDERRAQLVLEDNKTGERSSWVNPDTQNRVSVTPTRTFKKRSGRHQGRYCREYQTEVIVGGKRHDAYGTACRQPDGSWEIVK